MTTSESKSFRHKQYELLCLAKAVDGGKFAPALVVTKQVWPTRPREIAVSRIAFANAQDAIDSAHAQGLEWVQNYG